MVMVMGIWSLLIVVLVFDGYCEGFGLFVDLFGRCISSSLYLMVFFGVFEDLDCMMEVLRFRELVVVLVLVEFVYVSYGLVLFGMLYFLFVFRATVDALDELGLLVLFMVGIGVDVAVLGLVLVYVWVECWVLQVVVMLSACVVVGHGGLGMMWMVLAVGVL